MKISLLKLTLIIVGSIAITFLASRYFYQQELRAALDFQKEINAIQTSIDALQSSSQEADDQLLQIITQYEHLNTELQIQRTERLLKEVEVEKLRTKSRERRKRMQDEYRDYQKTLQSLYEKAKQFDL